MTSELTQWELELVPLLIEAGYASDSIDAQEYALEECWQQYKDDGYSPKDAIQEDLSYL